MYIVEKTCQDHFRNLSTASMRFLPHPGAQKYSYRTLTPKHMTHPTLPYPTLYPTLPYPKLPRLGYPIYLEWVNPFDRAASLFAALHNR
jgi:hypothetical protein